MLVLSRTKDESIDIGYFNGVPVSVTVLALRGDKVRLGISAPDHIDIHRREIRQRLERLQATPATQNQGEAEGQHAANG